jgi:long-chain acyl-CoA synthetase
MNTIEQGYEEFVERFEHICTTYKDKIAITYMRNDDSKTLFTFGEIFERVCAAKKQFADIGLSSGDRAAVIAPHSPYAIFAGFSLAYSNITFTLIDATLPVAEINKLINTSDIRAVFTVPEVYSAIDKSTLLDIPVFDLSQCHKEFCLFTDSPKIVLRSATIDPDTTVLLMLFSSGTTSEMKGVEITYSATMKALDMDAETTDITDDAFFLHVLPTFHIAGFNSMWAFFLYGSNIGMIEDFNATKLQRGLEEYQPTHFLVVPKAYEIMEQKIRNEVQKKGAVPTFIFSMLYSVCGFAFKFFGLNLGKTLLNFVRRKVFGNRIYVLGTGGSKCNASTARFFLNLGVSGWANFYASTETNIPAVTSGVFDKYPVGTEGRVDRFDGVYIKIHNPDENGIGEIRIKTVLIMKGYFRDPELTAAAFDDEGFFKTGDLGYIDKKNYLHVTGRMKEAIMLHTGKKVAPTDVDNFYSGLMGEIIFASCGVPNKDGTYDEIHLFIEKGELTADKQQELRNSIMELSGQTSTLYQLAGLHFIDKIPMTSIKKVKRFQLKEIALAKYNEKQ